MLIFHQLFVSPLFECQSLGQQYLLVSLLIFSDFRLQIIFKIVFCELSAFLCQPKEQLWLLGLKIDLFKCPNYSRSDELSPIEPIVMVIIVLQLFGLLPPSHELIYESHFAFIEVYRNRTLQERHRRTLQESWKFFQLWVKSFSSLQYFHNPFLLTGKKQKKELLLSVTGSKVLSQLLLDLNQAIIVYFEQLLELERLSRVPKRPYK